MPEPTEQLKVQFKEAMREVDPEAVEKGAFDTFKRDPDTFRYVHAAFLFKVWMSGRKSAGADDDD